MLVADDIGSAEPFRTRAERRRASAIWKEALGAERRYAASLRKLARSVIDIIGGFVGGDIESIAREEIFKLGGVLENYTEAITPWAQKVASRMVAEVNARNKAAWRKATNEMSAEMARIAQHELTNLDMRVLLAQQVVLIKSIPGEAALKAHELARIHEEIAIPAVVEGRRPENLVEAVRKIATWTNARPELIASTEVARTQTVLTQIRAQRNGFDQYIWRTARDYSVRPAHQRLEGTVHSWNDPPIAEDNKEQTRHHPGCFPRCRCVAIPIIKDRWAH